MLKYGPFQEKKRGASCEVKWKKKKGKPIRTGMWEICENGGIQVFHVDGNHGAALPALNGKTDDPSLQWILKSTILDGDDRSLTSVDKWSLDEDGEIFS